ncbi:DUF817 family protein [Brevundimonas sp. SL161]|uniref:DUF817 family protein n=1 Tax=Brevundimonas sp. SL161 TaxID=2804613 RepID=UPI003CF8C111
MPDSLRLPLESLGRQWLERLQTDADRRPATRFAFAFLMFGIKQAWACLFGGAMLGLILLTFLFWPDDSPVSRYDFLVIGAVLIQAAMLVLKLESWAEARVIASSDYTQPPRRTCSMSEMGSEQSLGHPAATRESNG